MPAPSPVTEKGFFSFGASEKSVVAVVTGAPVSFRKVT
jgi:hypothetical protein